MLRCSVNGQRCSDVNIERWSGVKIQRYRGVENLIWEIAMIQVFGLVQLNSEEIYK